MGPDSLLYELSQWVDSREKSTGKHCFYTLEKKEFPVHFDCDQKKGTVYSDLFSLFYSCDVIRAVFPLRLSSLLHVVPQDCPKQIELGIPTPTSLCRREPGDDADLWGCFRQTWQLKIPRHIYYHLLMILLFKLPSMGDFPLPWPCFMTKG